jgi:predicted dehydrogenase
MRNTPNDALRRRDLVLIGLGRAAALTLAGIESREDVRLVAAVDPLGRDATTRVPAEIDVGRSLDDLRPFDIAVVATPTATHPTVCRALFERCRGHELVLCEKPLADDPQVAAEVLDAAEAARIRFRVLFHFGFAAEVIWAREELARRAPVASVSCEFVDPYADDLDARTAALVSSWLDSGINALSVLARLVEPESVTPLAGDTAVDARVRVTFSSRGESGEGTIRTAWDTYARKATTVHLVDGTEIALDHRAATVAIDGREAFRGAADPSFDRYRLMLPAHLDDTELVHTRLQVLELHRLLASGAVER